MTGCNIVIEIIIEEKMMSIQDIYEQFVSLHAPTATSVVNSKDAQHDMIIEELEQTILKNAIFKNIQNDPESYGISVVPKNLFDVLKKYGPRKVCQYQFKR